MSNHVKSIINTQTRSEDLVRVAMGQMPADIIIKGGQLIDVFGEEIRLADVAIKGERIACVGNVNHTIGKVTRIIDAADYYLSPGLIDTHVHIEASMVTPTQFARVVLPTGNTTVLWETLWTGNVLGIEGIKFFLEEANQTPLKVFAAAASGVPSITPDLATPAHQFSLQDINDLLEMDQVATLGEVIYLNEVLNGESFIHDQIRLTLGKRKQVDGSAAGFTEEKLAAYAAAGVVNDHEAVSVEEAIHRIRNGMWLVLREGSGFHNLVEPIKAVTEYGLSPRRVCFCVDDKDASDILRDGTIDYMVREAIKAGVGPVTAVQMGSLNAAEYLRLDNDIGGIAPGMIADILFVKNLDDFRAHRVMVNGEIIAEDGKMTIALRPPEYPAVVSKTVHINRPLTLDDFDILTEKETSVQVRVIRVLPDQPTSYEEVETLPVREGKIELPEKPARDILKVAMIERHGKTPGPNIARGFVTGFGIHEGAMAASIAPDINQLIMIGDSDADMLKAVNRVIELQGGIVVCKQGQIIAEIALPIGGIISALPYEEMIPSLEKIHAAAQELGCMLPAAFMTMGFVGGVGGLPYLKISDLGLVDIMGGKLVPLEVE
jgi:adenine deaminase